MSFEGVNAEKLIAFLRQLSSWFYKTQFKLLMAFERSPSNFWPELSFTIHNQPLNNNTAATHGETWTKKKFEYPATIFSHDNPLFTAECLNEVKFIILQILTFLFLTISIVIANVVEGTLMENMKKICVAQHIRALVSSWVENSVPFNFLCLFFTRCRIKCSAVICVEFVSSLLLCGCKIWLFFCLQITGHFSVSLTSCLFTIMIKSRVIHSNFKYRVMSLVWKIIKLVVWKWDKFFSSKIIQISTFFLHAHCV